MHCGDRDADRFEGSGNISDAKKWIVMTDKLLQATCTDFHRQAKSLTIDYMVQRISGVFEDISNLAWTPELSHSLEKVLMSFVDIIRSLYVQPEEYDMELYHAYKNRGSAIFNPRIMEDIAGEEDSSLVGRGLQASLFPAVVKYSGKGMEVSSTSWNVVAWNILI